MSVTVEHDGYAVDSMGTAEEALVAIGGGAASAQGDGDAGTGAAISYDKSDDKLAPSKAETVAESADTQATASDNSADKEQDKPTGRPWKLLHETEKNLKAARKEAQDFKARLEALERPTATAPPVAQPQQPPAQTARPEATGAPARPKLSDFPDWDSYETARDAYDTHREAAIERKIQADFDARQQREQSQRQASQFEQEIAARLNAVDTLGRSVYPDWQIVIDSALQAGPWDPRVTTAIASHPKAEHLAYALAKDPEEARRLAAIQHPVSFGVEVGQFIARVTAASSTGSAQPARTTSAHAPLKPGGTSVGSAEANPDDLDFGPEYIAKMNAKERAKRRR